MRLSEVHLQGIVALGTRTVALGEVTAITGRTGSGKSLLLRLIHRAREAAAPYGGAPPSITDYVQRDAPGAKVQLSVASDVHERQRHGVEAVDTLELLAPKGRGEMTDVSTELAALLTEYTHDGSAGMFELVPAERVAGTGGSQLGMHDQRLMRASEHPEKYNWLSAFFADVCIGLDGDALPSRERVNRFFAEVGSELELSHATRVGHRYLPVFSTRYATVDGVAALSAGERQLAIFAGIVLLLRPRRSVLMIDNLERDLDPVRQRALLSTLSSMENQVLFTTTSETLLQAPEVTTVVRLEGQS